MQFDVLTLFPDFFESPLKGSILGRAFDKKLASIYFHDLRSFTHDRHRRVDDIPYGGGPGMVMKPEPLVEALESVTLPEKKTRRIYFSPQGRPLQQQHLNEYLKYEQIILLCGSYEGIDERIIENFIDEEVSIGDYILTGGEFAAVVFIDALVRLIPGVVGCAESLVSESFSSAFLEYPHYTRPPEFRGHLVPEVLLSGNHAKIEAWRQEQSLQRTQKKRPDLLGRKKNIPQK